MARNGSGTFTRINTFTSGATITAAGHNANWADLETEMTNSLAADGQTTMTGQLKTANGTVSAPSVTFGSDLDTGAYRKASDVYGIAAGGTQIAEIDSAGIECTSGIFAGMGAIPVGAIMDFAGSSAPTGWLLCQGQVLSQTTYAALYAVVSTTYNTGSEGAGNFRAPDYQGRVSAGVSNGTSRLTTTHFGASSGQNDTSLGSVGGLESHTLTTAQLAVTTPTGSISIAPTINGTTALPYDTLAPVTTGGASRNFYTVGGASSSTAISGTGTFSGASFGSGAAHANVQPTIIVNKIIFAGV